MNEPMSKVEKVLLVLVPLALLALLGIGLADLRTTQKLFVGTTYFFLLALVLIWTGTYLHAGRDLRRAAIVAWVKDNWPGLVVAAVVTAVASRAIEPGLWILSDEADLIGTSKNLFASRAATFTVSGKNYFDSYWDIDVAIDRRPALFPFLVSLVHVVGGYSYRHAFVLNLLLLPAFVLVAYRLAKSLQGETFAVVTALLVVAHPITLITVRSGGFDFLALFFALLVIKSLFDHVRAPSAAGLAVVWMNLCMFAEIRYESALFIVPVVALLLLFRVVSRELLRPYAFVYAISPAFFLPRIWQALLRGNIPEQELGIITFSLDNFLNNLHEYFQPILSPTESFPSHSALLIGLGVVGCLLWLRWLVARVRSKDWQAPQLRFAIFVSAWLLLQAIISFSYVWGRAQYPSAARLVIAFDTFFSFAAAWLLTSALARFRPFVPISLATAALVFQVPVAAQHRMLNRLTQTRESRASWKFFERLGEKRILIVTDRPNHFTIMDYGAMSFDSARRDPYLLTAFARRLFYDIYVIQQIKLSTNEPLPGYEIWPDRKLDTVLEFQNDADVLIRISRLAH